ncbi:MFS general substrate transporter [Hortaea werneckii]|nr:MFS general substrate transporter [Hortaea werneckii]
MGSSQEHQRSAQAQHVSAERHHHHALEPAEEPAPDIVPEHDYATREPEQTNEKIQTQQHSISDLESQRRPDTLYPIRSHVSTHDAPHFHQDEHYETGDEIYSKFSPSRKLLIVAILSFCSFLAPISSTSILAASPEVVSTYDTTATIFGVSNALYLVFMGLSPLFWGPLGQTYGRKATLAWSSITFTGFSVGSALAPNLASYFVFRMLTAFQGTSFLIVGASVIGDIYRPVERGTAYGWFLSGTLIGPALGPFIGGIIVTWISWRYIFWLQTALAGAASIAVVFLIPETIHHARKADLVGLPKRKQARKLWSWINPWRVIVLFRYPNLLVAGIASSSLVWNMYSLLTPIRYVLNPRFGLSTPWQGGLFYIAPGCGYLVGTFFGGKWADRVVKKWIKKRGRRIPEDRLHSCIEAMGIVIPACMLIYGWSVEKEVGGIPLPVIVMFIQGVAQLFCFPSLNTYCVDVMQKQSGEVVAGNYFIRYFFAAAGSAACTPVIDAIGVGWFSTISAAFLVVSAIGVWFTAEHGGKWREAIVERKEQEQEEAQRHKG